VREEWTFEDTQIGTVEILAGDIAFSNSPECGTWTPVAG